MKALSRLPLSNVADLNSKAQPRGDCAGDGAAIHADAVGVNQGVHFTGMQHLWRDEPFATHVWLDMSKASETEQRDRFAPQLPCH